MLNFQPPGFQQRAIATSLGVVAYYTPAASPWQPPSDAPTLVFLHSLGGGSSAYEWSKVYPAFANQYSVIAPELVGWGQSAHPVRDYRVEDYLQMLTEFLEQVCHPPTVVFAASLTAGIVIRLAIQRPDLFRQLILVAPSGYGDFGSNYAQSLSAQLAGVPGLNQLIYTLGAANERAVRNFLEQFLFARRDRISPEIVAAYLASATQMNAQYAALSALKGDLCFDLAYFFPQFTVPTVLLWGEKAWFSTLETGKRLASLNPTAVQALISIPDAGVLPHLEVPAVVVGLVQPWLNA